MKHVSILNIYHVLISISRKNVWDLIWMWTLNSSKYALGKGGSKIGSHLIFFFFVKPTIILKSFEFSWKWLQNNGPIWLVPHGDMSQKLKDMSKINEDNSYYSCAMHSYIHKAWIAWNKLNYPKKKENEDIKIAITPFLNKLACNPMHMHGYS